MAVEEIEEARAPADGSLAARPPPKGVRRLLEALPWPLAVIPPFVATLSLPILALAIAYGVVASSTHVVESGVHVVGRVEVYGMRAVAADRSQVDFGDLSDQRQAEASFFVTNSNSESAWVVVTARGIPPGCELSDFPHDAIMIPPGASQEVHVGMALRAEGEGGDYQFRLILLASPEQ